MICGVSATCATFIITECILINQLRPDSRTELWRSFEPGFADWSRKFWGFTIVGFCSYVPTTSRGSEAVPRERVVILEGFRKWYIPSDFLTSHLGVLILMWNPRRCSTSSNTNATIPCEVTARIVSLQPSASCSPRDYGIRRSRGGGMVSRRLVFLPNGWTSEGERGKTRGTYVGGIGPWLYGLSSGLSNGMYFFIDILRQSGNSAPW